MMLDTVLESFKLASGLASCLTSALSLVLASGLAYAQ